MSTTRSGSTPSAPDRARTYASAHSTSFIGTGWRTAGHAAAHPGYAPARMWGELGVCWAGTEHAVVDVTGQQAAGR